MKIPAKPPTYDELLEDIFKVKNAPGKIFSNPMPPVIGDRYLYWDKLRRLVPPSGWNHKEWWLAIKLSRMNQRRNLPLLDGKGNPFTFTLPDPALEYLHYIDKNGGGLIGSIDTDGTDPQAKERYVFRSLVEEAINSSQLEGATTTRQVAKDMIKNARKPKDKSEQMIMNNYWTMRLVQSRLKEPLSEKLLFELHAYLTEKSLDNESAAGRFRRSDEKVGVYTEDFENILLHEPPPATELNERMSAMYAFANGKSTDYFIPPVVRAIILHFWLSYNHPFVDGNGRCARALFYWSMLKQGYWLCEYLSISQIIKKGPARYGRAFLYS
jgi:Fic family protein